MDGTRKAFYIVIGLVITIPTASVFSALSQTELDLIEEEQTYAEKYTGGYYSDTSSQETQVFTYETLCKGFVIRHETDTEVQYIGYGDLKDVYTYTESKPALDKSASSSPILDTSTTTDGLQPSLPLDM